MKQPVTRKVAYCQNKWSTFVIVDADGKVFMDIANASIPFEPQIEYSLVDARDLHGVMTKYRMMEMINSNMKKKVDENYSSAYLDKYFREKVVKYPNLEVVHHIVSKYSEFLDLSFTTESEWGKKWNDIKSQHLTSIERDAKFIDLFMEFIK